MKHEIVSETDMAHDVLGLDDGEIAPFVRKCLKDRSLSSLVSHLNNDLLFGTPAERESAEVALRRIGFI